MGLSPRAYQTSGIQAIYEYFRTKNGNPLAIFPTGTGKSFVGAEFMRGAIQQWPRTRFIVATHVKELVAQNFAELMRLWPDAPSGILSAGLGSKSFHHQIIFCSIQTAYKHAFKLQHCDVLIVDEAHTIPHSAEGMWRKFIGDLLRINPHMKVLGLTATGYRLDSGLLHRGATRIFTDIAYEYRLLDAVKDGYLCEIVTAPTSTHLTIAGVHKRGGEFISGELEKAVDKSDTTQAAVEEILRLGSNRKAWLVFCAGIKHTEHVRDALRARGVTAEMVTAKTPNAERDGIISGFKSGHIRALCNTGVLTTGFNHPALDLIACLRPTGSAGLWVQMLGRGMRLAEGKTNCLLLDFAHNTDRHGPIDQIRGKDPKEKGSGEVPQKICPECHCYCHAAAKLCPDCAFVFPEHDINDKLTAHASNGVILSTQQQPKWVPVEDWTFHRHHKPGAPVSLRVEYRCGVQVHKEWVCLNHGGHARDKAVRWWSRLGGALPPPATVEEAIDRIKELSSPNAICLTKSGKYNEITGYRQVDNKHLTTDI